MSEFYPRQEMKLNLKVVERGVLFLFQRPHSESGDPLQVEQSWLSVHTLLSRLRKSQRYCAKDVPLLVWKQGEELHIKVYIPEGQMVEECVFSGVETMRILAMLEKLPGMN